jgi:hypothetical protein
LNPQILLSGLVGAVAATLISIVYQEVKERRQNKREIAKSRLENVYGPLLLMYDSSTTLTDEEQFLYSKDDEDDLDDIILQNYHLIEPERRDVLKNLYGSLRIHGDSEEGEIIGAIKEGFKENSKKAGIDQNRRGNSDD